MREVGRDRPDGAVHGGVAAPDADESDRAVAGRAAQNGGGGPLAVDAPSKPPVAVRAGVRVAVVLCLAMTLVHVLLVFLEVAPPNPVSRQYSRQVDAWVFPLFEQNWRLFAPDPESVNRRISARTMHTAADGAVRVSGWFDLSAVDTAAVRHDPFPSHTAQNMLRRAWTSYLETHGGDDRPHSQRAVMIQEYLRNIAAERVTARHHGAFESIQLRVVGLPIAAPAAVGPDPAAAAQKPVDTRYLPWWKVAPHAAG
ncbi:DUF5819 family protein [Streptomyces sp. NPDC086777]|uniref:DUF5819 family protein n=1 Tax=Streptomyces sp. NPDC086777 TaxID=3154866 RepID=UPI00344EC1D5